VVFIITERKHKSPFVPFTLFSIRYYSATTVFSLIQMAINFAIVLLVSLFLQEVTGLGAAQTGLIVGSLSLARFFFDPISGRVAELYGVRRPSLIGIVILTGVGVFFAIGLTSNTPLSLIFVGLFLSGIGLSLGRTPTNTAISHLVPAEYLGIGLGVFSMCTFVGGALGQTVFGTLLRNVSGAGSGSLSAVPSPDLSQAFTVNFVTLAGLMVVAGIVGLRMPKRREMNLQKLST
ncbi:MAG: MFS transporter, partial [Anaerolineales bacterium]|nr:MFS transporter [Anaerolineales bacterium]